MKDTNTRSRMALRLLLIPAIAVAAIAVVLVWSRPAQEHVEAAGGGPEMALSVGSGSTTCPVGTPPGTACVLAGNSFTLVAEAVGIPGSGYILAQTFIDYGTYDPAAAEDGGGPNSCSDGVDNGGGDGKDRLDADCVTVALVYKPAAQASNEFLWPDLESVTALRSQLGSGLVGHGGLTGLIPPQPVSTYIGDLVSLNMNCSPASTSTLVQLLPSGDPVAGTSGSLFTEPPSTQVVPKVGTLTIDCLGPTPTPTNTPIPPTPTPTLSPTPTNTPTPLPPPSERPDVKVTKVDLMDPVDSGTTYTYRITVESIGLQTATDVVVEDTLPAGAVFKSYSSTAATCNHSAGVVTCNVTDPMAPTDLITIDIVVNAPSPSSDTLVANTVTVTSSNEPFANTGNNKDIEQTVVLAPRADVMLQKVGDPTFLNGGEDVTYTLTARNLGPHEAENVQIVDTLPAGSIFVSATNPECGAPVGGQVTCNLGNLAVNGEASVQIVLTAPSVTRNVFLKNSAVVSADNELFLQTGNNLAIANTAIIAPPPDLIVNKTDSADPILRLGYFSYQIVVENIGLGDALEVVVTDTLPTISVGPFSIQNTTKFIDAVGADCAEGPPGIVVCTIAEVNVSDVVVITLNVRAPTLIEDQTIVNSVTVSASDPDEIPAGDVANESTLERACFDVNGDLIVDLPNDILGVILHSGLFSGDPGYDPIYDFDGDGFIGLAFDVLPTINHFYQDCSLLL